MNMWGAAPASFILPVQVDDAIPDFVPFGEPPGLTPPLVVEYPSDANEQGIEGKVALRIFIGRKGQLRKVEVIKGNDALNNATIDAVKRSKYEPAVFHGKKSGPG
ncbi:MAG: TonB family protein [Bacteroidales bacterium]|nr:TonB family protein [Bacteroidales bacterium]